MISPVRLVLSVALLGLSLAACSTVGPPAAAPGFSGGRVSISPEDATDAPMTYACQGGKRFVAAYALSGEHVVVQAGGRSYRLPHTPSASGARFSGGGVDLFTKGVEASLDGAAGAPYRACKTG
ncbi:MliC family protein [Phenylobacterium sp.]|uniref:MliC family protein n=1 Tax=Phenylobacterium sp. TaxID=1871053 RepID=UPI00272F8827|nr:MliC family protein [Phenylobacterium sp.]MDP1618925.1 MliC family protein [Phenylobacterium sp.]MDP1987140.1 MliC family protein [Phenylobacterium sp.]